MITYSTAELVKLYRDFARTMVLTEYGTLHFKNVVIE